MGSYVCVCLCECTKSNSAMESKLYVQNCVHCVFDCMLDGFFFFFFNFTRYESFACKRLSIVENTL